MNKYYAIRSFDKITNRSTYYNREEGWVKFINCATLFNSNEEADIVRKKLSKFKKNIDVINFFVDENAEKMFIKY